MSKVTKCDRCGEMFDPHSVDNCVKIRLTDNREVLGRIIRNTVKSSEVIIDICPACYDGFKAWFEMTYDREVTE